MHKPVMVREVIELTKPKIDSIVIDATFGFGGHARAFYEIVKNGLIVGFEKNPFTYEIAKELYKNYERIRIFNVGYENMLEVIEKLELVGKVDIVIFDLGLSLFLIKKSNLGFSYKSDEVLDMRFNPNEGKPLYEILEKLEQKEIEKILRNYGDIKHARKISYEIVRNKPIRRTIQLREIVERLAPRNKKDKLLKKTFQAFRIFVNDEVNTIKKGLLNAYKCLKIEGRLAVLSYHSIEDRIVKNLSKSPLFIPLFKKPLTPSQEEILENPRSRSAKLRVFLKK
ncbi:MAG: 16S rRNA (cytosine(1402)-N(4))-methyltransferase RsmH [candidate division WOR-3 bacterium]|nr:16S rRNA (cytosine(1402)-N(4))-methyltransferase RsmH [candidate division WOR-3 bacterium]MDW8150741.1 16S rRNA (cytosine(1402)-N(4))-methyltransferase RsmH [candidate division WOR-3 bacterium]